MVTAFADESYDEAASEGCYVLAAAIFDPAAAALARTAMRETRGKRQTGKLHWNEMDDQQRRNAAKIVGALPGIHVVTVGTPVPVKRQERARAKCLHRLVLELHGCGISHLLMESRTHQLNRRDLVTVASARFQLPRGAQFRVEHRAGATDPLFWVADIVAGAVRANRRNQPGYLRYLVDCLYEFEVATEC